MTIDHSDITSCRRAACALRGLVVGTALGAAGAGAPAMATPTIHPLAEALAVARVREPGEVVDTRLAREQDRLVYVFKVIGAHGRRHRLALDAATLAIVDDR